jgi:hypothetical protein
MMSSFEIDLARKSEMSITEGGMGDRDEGNEI